MTSLPPHRVQFGVPAALTMRTMRDMPETVVALLVDCFGTRAGLLSLGGALYQTANALAVEGLSSLFRASRRPAIWSEQLKY